MKYIPFPVQVQYPAFPLVKRQTLLPLIVG